jgi:hypothetical protein
MQLESRFWTKESNTTRGAFTANRVTFLTRYQYRIWLCTYGILE